MPLAPPPRAGQHLRGLASSRGGGSMVAQPAELAQLSGEHHLGWWLTSQFSNVEMKINLLPLPGSA